MTAMSEAYEHMTDTAEQERVEDEAAEMEHYCRWSEGVAGKLEGKYGGGDPEAEAPVEIAAATYLRKLASEVRRLRARQREDTRTIGLALNDIRSIVRQDWAWTTELQRHYDLAMDALRPEPPTEGRAGAGR